MVADWGLAFALEACACVATGRGLMEISALLWGAAEKLREVIGAPLLDAYRDVYANFKALTSEGLGDLLFRTVWQKGRTLPKSESYERAFALTGTA